MSFLSVEEQPVEQRTPGSDPCDLASASRLLVLVVGSAGIFGFAAAATAQITLDGSLPNQLAADGSIKSVPFDGGAGIFTLGDDLGQYSTTGENLFHSLGEFRLGDGQELRVTVSQAPQRVITRVTGGAGSYFGGRVTAVLDASQTIMPGVDYFHIDPAGITFGSGANLNMGGSVYLSTADQLVFSNGAVLESSNTPLSGALLAAAAPEFFGFLGAGRALVEFDESTLRLDRPESERFVVVAGDVVVRGQGSLRQDSIALPGGEISLAAVGNSVVDVPTDVTSFDPSSVAGELGEVRLENGAIIDVSGGFGRFSVRAGRFRARAEPGAPIQLRALRSSDSPGSSIAIDIHARDEVDVAGGRFQATTNSDLVSGGDIEIRANAISLDAMTFVATDGSGAAPGGSIRLQGESVRIVGGSQVFTTTAGSGAAGGIDVVASDLEIDDGAVVWSGTRESGTGAPGAIRIEARTLRLGNLASIQSANNGADTAGPIELVDLERLELTGGSSIDSVTRGNGAGAPIRIDAQAVELAGASRILSQTEAAALGGEIRIEFDGGGSADLMLSGGSLIQSSVTAAATGTGGAIHVDTGSAGWVQVDGLGAVTEPSQIVSQTAGAGTGGSLTLFGGEVELLNGGQLRTTTVGAGDAGALTIDLAGVLLAVGNTPIGGSKAPSGVFARSGDKSLTTATGAGGRLEINARAVELRDGAEISARTFGLGRAGELRIDVEDGLLVEGGANDASTISLRADEGDGNLLTITADRIELTNGGVVSGSTVGRGDAGVVDVTAREILVRGANPESESGFFSQTLSGAPDAGDAGGLQITASESLHVLDGGRLAVSSEGGGRAGDLSLDGAGEIVIDQGGSLSATVRDTRAGAGESSILVSNARSFVLGSGAEVSTETAGRGAGGSIEIAAGQIELMDGSALNARSTSSLTDAGVAGEIRLRSAGDLIIAGASVRTDAANAAGGSILLGANRDVVLRAAEVRTSVRGLGADQNAGNILIGGMGESVPRFVVLKESIVSADAIVSTAGNISITAGAFLASATSVLSANSELGISGIIVINAPATDVTAEVVALPSAFLDVSALLRDRCAARSERAGTFLVETRAARVRRPDDLFEARPLDPGSAVGKFGDDEDPWGCPGAGTDWGNPQEDEA